MPRRAAPTDASRTATRSPSKRRDSASTAPSRTAHANHTSPTGLSGAPPAGPATPVTATAMSARLWASAPATISRTVASLTAPQRARVAGATPSSSTFASFEYVTKPRSNHSELPATSVIAPATRPPVHDSAVASLHRRSARARPTLTASGVGSFMRLIALSRQTAVVIGVRRGEPELAVDRERRRIVGAHLQVGGVRAVLPRPRQECRAGERRVAVAARTLGGDDVVEAGEIALDHGLGRADHAVARAHGDQALLERRVQEALAMRFALRRRRRAQRGHGVDERVDGERLHRHVVARGRQLGRTLEPRGLDERFLEGNVAARVERRLEVGGTVERRHPEQRREAVLRVDALAVLDLGAERQRRAEVRIDAARALRLARGQPQEPAVVEQLPLRLQRVQARLLDAPRVDHARSRSARAKASSV